MRQLTAPIEQHKDRFLGYDGFSSWLRPNVQSKAVLTAQSCPSASEGSDYGWSRWSEAGKIGRIGRLLRAVTMQCKANRHIFCQLSTYYPCVDISPIIPTTLKVTTIAGMRYSRSLLPCTLPCPGTSVVLRSANLQAAAARTEYPDTPRRPLLYSNDAP